MTTKQDPKKVNTKTKNKNKKRDWSFYAIIVCSILLLIPAVFLGYNILQATKGTGKPLFGHRFDGDLEPKIDDAKLTAINEKIKGVAHVETVSSDVKSATVRFTVKVAETTEKDAYPEIANAIYEVVTADLPVDQYFKRTDTQKMYDVEINVYNILTPTEAQRPNFLYYLFNKNSNVEEAIGNFVSEPLSPELVEKLIAAEQKADEKPETTPSEETPEGETEGETTE